MDWLSASLLGASTWLQNGRAITPLELRGLQFLVAAASIAITASLVTFLVAPIEVWPMLATFIALLLALLGGIRLGMHPRHGQTAALLIVGLFLFSMCIGTPAPHWQQLYWFAVLPLSGGLLVGPRGMSLGVLASFAGAAAVVACVHWGLSGARAPLEYEPSQVVDLVLFLSSVAVLSAVYTHLQSRAVDGAERSARARSAFLAQMSHELRTPMNGVLGMLQLLDDDVPLAQQREQLALMRRSGEAMVAIIDDLLDFARLETEQLDVVEAPFDARLLAQDVLALYRRQAAANEVVLSLEVAPSVPRWIAGDVLRVGQVLRNLVSNAVKFTAHGGVRVRIDHADGRLVGVVEDDGIGIDAAQLGQLFTPFRQASPSTAARYGGSGLGLAISRGLCRRMGGDLEAQSSLGEGSRFTFSCAAPRCAPPAQADEAADTAQRRLRGRILLVDDNDTNRVVGRRLCERAGLEVRVAEDGAVALAVIEQDSFDLVLMDCQMPVLDGFEATRRIRVLPGPMALVPIVALTASTMPEELERCRAVGMNDVVPKPLNARVLVDVLERNLRPSA